MRANSLTNLGVALDYNVVSDYDKVLVVAGLASEIEELAPHANEIATLVANLPDVLTVQEASELVNNLMVKVTTLPAGSTATSELVGTEIRLGIPAGTQGAQGIQGPKGAKGDKGDIGLTGAKGPAGATGPQGLRGFRGEDGLDGEGVVITSVLNNINNSITINFSDGTQHTTDPLKGEDGRSVTITNVVNNANGTMLINFSDGTSHHTADLRGPIGFKGDTGDHVHHISYQRSKDPMGNEVGPTEPGRPGYDDTYAMWTSQEELPEMFIGEFVTHNGLNTLTAEEQAKLDSVEFGATRDQVASEVAYDNAISGLLSEDIQNSIDELSATKLNLIEKGHSNGVASLDSNGLVPSSQLPSYVDDVLEYATYADLPVTGEEGKIYVVIADETSGGNTSSYRWTGTVYAMVSNTLTAADVKALYESNADTNNFSDAEKALLAVHTSAIDNPHAVTKAQVGLSNADNTSDNVKNVLSATKLSTARTINGVSFDGRANITVSDSTAVKLTGDQTIAGVKTFSSNPISTATQSTATNALTRKDYVDTKAPIASPTFTGTVTLPTTTSIGDISSTELGYLDGVTSNIQTQLAGKALSSHTHPVSQVTGLGTAATKNVGTSAGNVMEVGAFGLGTSNPNTVLWNISDVYNLPSGIYKWTSGDNKPSTYGSFIQVGMQADRKAQISLASDNPIITFSSIVTGALLYSVNAIHTGNLLQSTGTSTTYPMSQKATTDVINAIYTNIGTVAEFEATLN